MVLCGQEQLPQTDPILIFIELADEESVSDYLGPSQRSCPTSKNNYLHLLNFTRVSVGINAFVLMESILLHT